MLLGNTFSIAWEVVDKESGDNRAVLPPKVGRSCWLPSGSGLCWTYFGTRLGRFEPSFRHAEAANIPQQCHFSPASRFNKKGCRTEDGEARTKASKLKLIMHTV